MDLTRWCEDDYLNINKTTEAVVIVEEAAKDLDPPLISTGPVTVLLWLQQINRSEVNIEY